MNESACFTHIYIHTLIYTCLPSSDRSAGNTRRIRELESIYRIYTAGVTLLPNRPQVGPIKFYDLYPSRISRS